MRFRTGKYAGLTIEHVKKIAPWYIQWVRENRPEMLRESRQTQPKPYNKPVYVDPPDIPKAGAIQPNYDFGLEEKPSPYLASLEEAFGMNFPKKS